jgi:hypothetical protein
MSLLASDTVRRRTVWAADALLVVWVLAWVAVGIWVAVDVNHLGRLADTLGTAAAGLGQVSHGLGQLSKLPLVGHALTNLASAGSATAASASVNATTAKSSVDQLAYLLGTVIVVIPSVPALVVYLPFRIHRIRDRRAVATALSKPAEAENLRRWLANRALATLSYSELVGLLPEPGTALAGEQVDTLAGAELARLGFDRRLFETDRRGPQPRPPAMSRRRPS